jgi:hypothetical protein
MRVDAVVARCAHATIIPADLKGWMSRNRYWNSAAIVPGDRSPAITLRPPK